MLSVGLERSGLKLTRTGVEQKRCIGITTGPPVPSAAYILLVKLTGLAVEGFTVKGSALQRLQMKGS